MNIKRVIQVPLFALGVVALLGADDLTEAAFDCEQAVAHLAECCPGLAPEAFHCVDDGCNDQHPDLTIPDAKCVLEQSCSSLRDNGMCDAAQKAAGRGAHVDNQTADQFTPVCS